MAATLLRLKATNNDYLSKIGAWLDKEMPNPTVDQPMRWSIADSDNGTFIAFADEKDATIFTLKWL